MESIVAAETRAGSLPAIARLVVLPMLFLAVLGTYGERWGLNGVGAADGSLRVGAAAPAFKTTTLQGEAVSLDQFRGRVVVLNFWATWCPPCRLEMPDLEAYQAEMTGRVVVLGVNAQEPPSMIAPFVSRYGLTFPMLLDEDGAVNATYQVTGFPTTYILDRSGIIREKVIGAMTRDGLASRVERLL